MRSHLNVVTACDRNYIFAARVLVRSLAKYSSRPLRIYAIVPERDLKTVEIQNFRESFFGEWNIDLQIIGTCLVDEWESEGLIHADGYITPYTFLKLTFDSVLPEDVKDFVYIDPDAMVNRDLEVIFQYFPTKTFAAVAELHPWAEERLGNPDTFYFNAGFFFTNRQYFKGLDLINESVKYLSKHGQPRFMEQDLMNSILGRDWEKLPITFNSFSYYSDYLYVIGAASNPLIVHFAGEKKPWLKSTSESNWVKKWRELYCLEFDCEKRVMFNTRKQHLEFSLKSVLRVLKNKKIIRLIFRLLPNKLQTFTLKAYKRRMNAP